MPKLTTEFFPIQIKSNFKILSEFFNISTTSSHSIWKKFVFSGDCFIFLTIRLNKIVIFLKKIKTFSLFNIIRNDSSSIGLLKFSPSGTKFSFTIKQKTIVIFKLSKRRANISQCDTEFFFNKTLEFSCNSEKTVHLISSCFNNDEKYIFMSFSNGKILFLMFDGKILSILKMENPVFSLSPGIGIRSKFELYGILKKKSLIVYDFKNKECRNFKKSKKYIIQKNFIILFENTNLEIYCFCHQKIFKKIIFSWEIKEILPIEKNKILIWGNQSLFNIDFNYSFLKSTEIYHFEKNNSKKSLFNLNDIFLTAKQKCIFSILIKRNSSSYLEIKPLTEKIKFFIHTNTMILKNDTVNSANFFGKKNSIIIGNNNEFINIFNGSSFTFIGSFPLKNAVVTEIIVKNNLFLVTCNFKEILLFNFTKLTLLRKICYPDKISTEFSIKNQKNPKCYLISGSKEGILRVWNIFFQSHTKVQFKLIWSKNIANDVIVSVSISEDCELIACLTRKKGLFLTQLKDLNFKGKIETDEKKINCLKFCPKSKILCAGTYYGTVILFDVTRGTSLKAIKGDTSPVLSFCFNNKGSILTAGFKDGTVKIISIHSPTISKILGNHDKPIFTCSLSEDEKILTGCSGGKLVIFKDISLENSEKQDRKFSEIFFLKKLLKIKDNKENFKQIFKRLIFTKNPFMLIDFLDFTFKRNFTFFKKIFIKIIQRSNVSTLSFTLKSLILWNQIKKKQNFVYKLAMIILDNLKLAKVRKIDFAILKGANKLIEEWILDINKIQKLSLKTN